MAGYIIIFALPSAVNQATFEVLYDATIVTKTL